LIRTTTIVIAGAIAGERPVRGGGGSAGRPGFEIARAGSGYFFAGVTMNGETETGAAFLSAFGLRTSLLDFF